MKNMYIHVFVVCPHRALRSDEVKVEVKVDIRSNGLFVVKASHLLIFFFFGFLRRKRNKYRVLLCLHVI